jgi:hypothetical protein
MKKIREIMQYITYLLLLVTAGFTLWNTIKIKEYFKPVYKEYSYAYDCHKEAELKFYETKSLLCTEVQKYIDSVAPSSNLRGYAIVEECFNYDVDIAFVLAQGEIESHYATKGIGGKLNNVFNVGVYDDFTLEDVSKTYKYEYPNQSIRPYLNLLKNRYLVNKLEEDLLDNFVDINGNRYASDVHYENKLREKIIYIRMHTNIDKLQGQLINYATKCNR